MAVTAGHVLGALGIEDTDLILINQIGQQVVFEDTQAIINQHNVEVMEYERLFVERDTSEPKALYFLTIGGEMEKITNLTQPKAVKVGGKFNVAFPLEEWGAKIAGDRVALAYLSAAQYGRNIAAVLNADAKLRRREILRALFHNAPPAFKDEVFGDLAVMPLANGDTQLYPPTVEADDATTANHYLTTNYAPATISNTNDPFPAPINLLESHFGLTATGSNIVTFMNVAQVPLVKLLAKFVPIENRYERLGNQISVSMNLPDNLPGVPIGTYDGLMPLIRWDRIPANYLLTIHLDAPPPLIRRGDRPGTGLGPPGLKLIQERVDEPLRDAWWSNRFGYGVGNRISCVVTYIATGTTYAVPPRYLLA
jgi:hypothetical protein